MRRVRRSDLLHSCGFVAWALGAACADDLTVRLETVYTRTRCELLGLGARDTVPYNFPGANAAVAPRYRALNAGIVEAAMPAGENARVPAISGGDLGAPFVHGDGRLYFSFGDAWFESASRMSQCDGAADGCVPARMNDDLLASTDAHAADSGDCIALDMPYDAYTGDVAPITWDGPGNAGGKDLGGPVPGPGFSTGRHLFLMMPASKDAWPAPRTLRGDVCKIEVSGFNCYFVVDAHFYDRDAGIYLRWAKQPWGPWSEPITIFNPYHPGQGGYCEQMFFEDLAGKSDFICPRDKAARNRALNRVPGSGLAGEYGAAIVPGSVHELRGHVSLRWLLSTWNPYRVILQESSLDLSVSVSAFP